MHFDALKNPLFTFFLLKVHTTFLDILGCVKWAVNLFRTSQQKCDFHIFCWIKMTSIFSMLKLVLSLLNASVLEVWSTITQTC